MQKDKASPLQSQTDLEQNGNITYVLLKNAFLKSVQI